MLVMKTRDGPRPIALVQAFGQAPMCCLRARRVQFAPNYSMCTRVHVPMPRCYMRDAVHGVQRV